MTRPLVLSPLVQEKALLALPILVRCAQRRQTITYGELAGTIDWHWRPLRLALGYIRDEICRPRGLPLTTALVVNCDTKMPGQSFLPEGTSHRTDAEYRAAFERLRGAAFAYAGWDALPAELGLRPVPDR